jgi:hypothetical protein
MKKLIKTASGIEVGVFSSVTEQSTGYLADTSFLPYSVLGTVEVLDVSDDYKLPVTNPVSYDAQKRKDYAAESDPLFFKWQRGESTKEAWLDKVAEIRARYPETA